MDRQDKRALCLVGIFAFGALLVVLGLNGWVIRPAHAHNGPGLPAQYGGFFLIAYGILGVLGVNIWFGGPLDPRNDHPGFPDEQSEELDGPGDDQPDLLRIPAMERDAQPKPPGPVNAGRNPSDKQRPAA